MKHIIMLLFALFMGFILYPAVVSNLDKPLKGEWNSQYKKVLEIKGYEDKSLAVVQKFCVTDNGDIYLFDRKHFTFFVFDKEGKPKFSFGREGEGPGEVKLMLSFFLVGDYLIVADMGRVHYFGLDGKYKKSVPTSSSSGVAPLAFIDENRLVKTRITDFSGLPETVEIFNLETKTSTYFEGGPLPDNKTKSAGVIVLVHTDSKNFEQKPNFVAGKLGNKILWGKNDTYLINVCDFSGKKQFSFSIEDRKPKEITEEYKKKVISRMKLGGGGEVPDVIKKELMKGISDHSTYFFALEAGQNDLIYVFVSNAMRENGREIDIFSPDGKYLYHTDIAFPESQKILANGIVFKGDFLYVVLEDDSSGELSLQKYSIKMPPNPSI